MRCLIAILFPLCISAQNEINSTQFLKPVAESREGIIQTRSEKINIPWIEVYEIRSETRDFELDEQEYTVRLTPNSIKKRRAQKALYNQIISLPDFDGEKIRCDRLVGAFEDWVIMHIMQSKLGIIYDLEIILNDRVEVLNRMMAAQRPDLKEITDVQKSINELKTGKYELEMNLALMKSIYAIEGLSLEVEDLVSSNSIASRIALMSFDAEVIANPEDHYEIELIDRELDIEKAEDQQIFDFAQFRYQGPHTDPFEERFSLGLGLRLPNRGNQKIKIKELMLEKERLQIDQNRIVTEELKQLEFQKRELMKKINALKYLKTVNTEEAEKLEQISQNIQTKVGADPLFLLDIQERLNRMKLKEIQRESEILLGYIELLEDSNALCSLPFENALKE